MVKQKRLDFSVIRNHARQLRINMTEEEKILWNELRNRKLKGYKFLRQHPIVYKGDLDRLYYFVADFYCPSRKAVIELDGPIHDIREDYDNFRDSEMTEKGINILRIKNDEIRDLAKVLERILSFLNSI